MSDDSMETILLIGARGYLGSKVLDALIDKYKDKDSKKYQLQVLIREGSDASRIESKAKKNGITIEIIRGDMMDIQSLKKAFVNVHVIINTANGYMSGNSIVDTDGVQYVINAIVDSAPKLRRYVYCSVLTCDQAQGVDHFWTKKLGEDYAKSRNISYIALRPGGFLDQSDDYLSDAIQNKLNGSNPSFCVSMWDKTIPIGFVYTPDLAQYFVNAIDIEENDETKQISIDIGWTKPVSYQSVVDIVNTKLERIMTAEVEAEAEATPPPPTPFTPLACYTLPRWLRMGVIYTLGYISEFWGDMFRMFNYFDTGVYVNTIELQTKYFGTPPTPEDAINRYVDQVVADNLRKIKMKEEQEAKDKAAAAEAASTTAAAAEPAEAEVTATTEESEK